MLLFIWRCCDTCRLGQKVTFCLKSLFPLTARPCFQLLRLVTRGFHLAISWSHCRTSQLGYKPAPCQLLSHGISNSKEAKSDPWLHENILLCLSAVSRKWQHCLQALISTILGDNTGDRDFWKRVVIAKKWGAELNPQNTYGALLDPQNTMIIS